MLQYSDLNNDEKRKVKETLGINRLGAYYFEDNGYMLMDSDELFEYIYLCDIKKLKDALALISSIKEKVIKVDDANKKIQEMLIESCNNVTKISNRAYLYKHNN